MLSINGVKYEDLEKYIDFNPYETTSNGIKRKGKALYITIKTEEFILNIETTYDFEWIKGLKINDENDISKFIIGLPYEDKNGWMYLTNECSCTINRINDNFYNIKLTGSFDECDEQLNIEYNDVFEIKQLYNM